MIFFSPCARLIPGFRVSLFILLRSMKLDASKGVFSPYKKFKKEEIYFTYYDKEM